MGRRAFFLVSDAKKGKAAAGALRSRKLREEKANWKAERDSTPLLNIRRRRRQQHQTKRPTESIAGVAKENSSIEADGGLKKASKANLADRRHGGGGVGPLLRGAEGGGIAEKIS